MKRILGISLGSSARDKRVVARFSGEDFEIERRGTDGDTGRFRSIVTEMDGKVDAFGVGGMDIYLYAGDRKYLYQEPLRLMSGALHTPYADGSGLKHTLEAQCIAHLEQSGEVDFAASRVLLVSAVDRAGMAKALAKRARSIVFGDILYGLQLPVPVRSYGAYVNLARLALPVITRLPVSFVYPTGDKQNQNTPRFTRYFDEADIIAGDFHLIKRFMPLSLAGKQILTNTITEADSHELKRRGVHKLITTTPRLEGRSFGTNVMEAVLMTIIGKRADQITPDEYLARLNSADWAPSIEVLNP